MSPLQRLIVGFTAIGLATTATLPGRGSQGLVKAVGSAVQGIYYTVITGKK